MSTAMEMIPIEILYLIINHNPKNFNSMLFVCKKFYNVMSQMIIYNPQFKDIYCAETKSIIMYPWITGGPNWEIHNSNIISLTKIITFQKHGICTDNIDFTNGNISISMCGNVVNRIRIECMSEITKSCKNIITIYSEAENVPVRVIAFSNIEPNELHHIIYYFKFGQEIVNIVWRCSLGIPNDRLSKLETFYYGNGDYYDHILNLLNLTNRIKWAQL